VGSTAAAMMPVLFLMLAMLSPLLVALLLAMALLLPLPALALLLALTSSAALLAAALFATALCAATRTAGTDGLLNLCEGSAERCQHGHQFAEQIV
jgi:hypothetical protein